MLPDFAGFVSQESLLVDLVKLCTICHNLTYFSPKEVVEMAREDEVFTHVLEAEKMFVRNREEMLKYEAQERYEMDMATIKADGRAEGRAEGKLEALLDTAREMLAGGLSIEQVKKFTKLTDKELASLL